VSDGKLRELERAFRESGAVEDEAAWLRERVRVGDLAADRLSLARALGAEGLGALDPGQSFSDWLASLRFRVKRGRVELNWARVPIAMARALHTCVTAVPAPSVEHGVARTQVFETALELSEGLLVGRRASVTAARTALQELIPEPHSHRWGWVYLPPLAACCTFVDAALELLDSRSLPTLDWSRVIGAALNPQQTWTPDPDTADAIESAIQDAFPRQQGRVWGLRMAVRQELVPWALGYRDPVGERVEARQRKAED
jgi:hypothetical protein